MTLELISPFPLCSGLCFHFRPYFRKLFLISPSNFWRKYVGWTAREFLDRFINRQVFPTSRKWCTCMHSPILFFKFWSLYQQNAINRALALLWWIIGVSYSWGAFQNSVHYKNVMVFDMIIIVTLSVFIPRKSFTNRWKGRILCEHNFA